MPYKDPVKQRQAEIRAHAKRQLIKRQLIRDAKDKPCVDCGGSFPYYVMQLDHRDPKTKFKKLASMHSYSTERIIEEIEKCDPVCANCHAVRTYNHMALSSSGSGFVTFNHGDTGSNPVGATK